MSFRTNPHSINESIDNSELKPENHPIFWRILKENPHHLPSWKEMGLMWELITKNDTYNFSFNSPKDKQKAWSQFRLIFSLVENLFSEELRSDWTPYFYHLLETAFILVEESEVENSDIETLFTAILHDIIEDTDQDYKWLLQCLNLKKKEIAFGVQIISKPHFSSYIDHDERGWYKEIMLEIDADNVDLSGNIIDESKIDANLLNRYNYFRKKYKFIRNEAHFKNYIDYETFKTHARKEAKELWESFSDVLLDIICKRSLNVKFADRLHNLRTIDHLSNQRIFKKIHETIDYIVPIAKEVNPIMAQKLQDEIQKLQTLVASRTIWNISDEVKKSTHNVTKNS